MTTTSPTPGTPIADGSPPVAHLSRVTRRFGDVCALTEVDIEVPRGAITVLLGPNGAGKTTAIRMITGALIPDTGSVRVFGRDPGSIEGENVRRRCGVVSAKPSLYDRLSGWDNLRYAAQLYGVGRGRNADETIAAAAAQFGIDAALDHQVGGYSTGMKTRLALARAVLHQPELLLLDEPTSGLDPESAMAVLGLIRDMTAEGRTVLMCTHLLLEAEGLADHIVMMGHGTSLLSGAPQQLATQFWPTPVVHLTTRNGTGLDHLARHGAVQRYERHDDTATLEVASLAVVGDLVRSAVAAGAEVQAVTPFVPTLEDLYFAIRGAEDPSRAGVAEAFRAPGRTARRSRVAEMSR